MIRLTQREKLLVVASVVLVAAWLLFTSTVKPAIERVETLGRVIPEKQAELRKLRAKSNEYIFLRNSLGNLRVKAASQEKKIALLPFLESLIRESGLTRNVATMKQQELLLEPGYNKTIVEIKLESLTLGKLVNFLRQVESSEILARIKSLYIEKNLTNADLLDSVVEVHNLKLTQD